MSECTVCGEDCNELLPCRHSIHMECVARSGRARCPLCLTEGIQIPQEYSTLFQEAVQRNRNTEEEQNRQAAIELHRQLQRRNDDDEDDNDEENEDENDQQDQPRSPPRAQPPRQRDQLISIGYDRQRWRDRSVETYTLDTALQEVAYLNYNTERNTVIETDRRSVQLIQIGMSLRQFSLHMGVSMRQLVDVLLLALDE